MIDVAFSQDGGQRPDIIVADTGSYSDMVFGIARLLDMQYRLERADLHDRRSWRIDRDADCALGLVINCVVLPVSATTNGARRCGRRAT